MLGLIAENGAEIEASVAANEIPKSAALIAEQSLAPSPHIEQTTPKLLNALITIALCSGLHLPNKAHLKIKSRIGFS